MGILLGAVEAGSKSALEVESVESIGHHYCKALRLWRENFERNWPGIRESYERTHTLSAAEIEAFRRRWIVGRARVSPVGARQSSDR